jgi:glyoxylate carboligase
MLYGSQLLYVSSIGLSKCSATLFLGSLSRVKRHTTAASALTAASITWTIGSCLAVALRAPLTAPWENVGSLVCWRSPVLHMDMLRC